MILVGEEPTGTPCLFGAVTAYGDGDGDGDGDIDGGKDGRLTRGTGSL